MLSRFSLAGGLGLRTSVIKFQPVCAITTSAASSECQVQKEASNVHPMASKYPPEFPPPTSKRDFINFPRPVMTEYAPPVRFGFIPDTWFKFFYPKTGYTGNVEYHTGPYLLMATFGTYLFSKEIIVIEGEFCHALSFILLLTFIHHKFGDKIGEAFNKQVDAKIHMMDAGQENEKQAIRDDLKDLENEMKMKPAIVELTKATKEMVNLQMELAFRERLETVYKSVKNKLDCQAELENVERRFSQKNLMDYVLRNVMKSITPELEKSMMQSCVKDLNALASKA